MTAVEETNIPGVLVLTPKVFGDERGYFLETHSKARYQDLGVPGEFVQDNLSKSTRGILRGLHCQAPYSQGKLVSVPFGSVFDVVVDIRLGSPSFGQWFGLELSDKNHKQLWIPQGCAHGFVVTSDECLFAYKCDEYYHPETEFTVRWNDPRIGVKWPILEPKLSPKDLQGALLQDISEDRLPRYKESSL